jgi:predicted nucleotidyltransferase
MKHFDVAHAVLQEKHPNAMGAFWAGSIARGEGTPTSDIDLVIIYPHLERAWRDSFYHQDQFCETFVHDLVSIEQFFASDAQRGVPSLINMVFEGKPLLDNPVHMQLKLKAQAILAKGPDPWTEDQINRSRYTAADLMDDLLGAGSHADRIAIGMLLYQHSFEHLRRSRQKWSARGKHIVRTLRREEGVLGEQFLDAFDTLFKTGETHPVQNVVDQIFAPCGGPLHIWRQDAPPHR